LQQAREKCGEIVLLAKSRVGLSLKSPSPLSLCSAIKSEKLTFPEQPLVAEIYLMMLYDG